MSRTVIIILLLVVGVAPPAMAVDTLEVTSPDPMLSKWRWTEFDQSNGLTGKIWNLFEDRDGNIWFSSDQNVQRYDGLNWTTYTTEDGLASNDIGMVYQTRDGAMWFGTWGQGISRFDPSTGSGQAAWTTYTTEDGLATNLIYWNGLHEARDGTLWAGFWTFDDSTGTQSGISRFDGQTWTTLEVPVGAPRLSGWQHLGDSVGSTVLNGPLTGALKARGHLETSAPSWVHRTAACGPVTPGEAGLLSDLMGQHGSGTLRGTDWPVTLFRKSSRAKMAQSGLAQLPASAGLGRTPGTPIPEKKYRFLSEENSAAWE